MPRKGTISGGATENAQASLVFPPRHTHDLPRIQRKKTIHGNLLPSLTRDLSQAVMAADPVSGHAGPHPAWARNV